MKRFIVQSFIFALVLNTYFLTNYLINIYFINENPPKIDESTLIMGDSHTMTGLNPELMANSRNISQTAEPYPITYYKLREIAKHNKFDTLIVGFGHHNLASFNDDKLIDNDISKELFNRTYSIIKKTDLQHINNINYASYIRTYIIKMITIPRKNHNGYLGSFISKKRKLNQNDTMLDATISRHFISNNISGEISKSCINYLDSIVNLTKAYNIKLILVTMPVHPQYRNLIPEKIKVQYNILKESYNKTNVIILDYSIINLSDHLFNDFDHLNNKGAEIITKKIIKDLKLHK